MKEKCSTNTENMMAEVKCNKIKICSCTESYNFK